MPRGSWRICLLRGAGEGSVWEMPSYAEYRKDYSLSGLLEKDLAKDPIRQFEKWFQEADAAKVAEPNAAVLSTCSREGRPSSRTILLKGVDGRGFVFYGNYDSRKGRELAETARASLLFPWVTFERQVIIEGTVQRISREESDAYFHSRPRQSQLGAWASPQSTIISNRKVLEDNLKELDRKYAGKDVPLPPNWGGFRLAPDIVEFWQGRRGRLHDRLRFRSEKDGWIVERLAP